MYCKMMMQWFLFLLFLISFPSQMPIVQSVCNHQAELSALLHFKDGFQVNCTNSAGDDLGYSKTSSWKNGSAEWDGVECAAVTGHVIALDLSSSCLHGPIDSSSSIFSRLVHLEHLNLAFNDFQHSSIPSEVSNLSRLSYLNLSSSYFVGRVPLEISKLFMLASLDLSYNYDLEINLKSLVGNLTNLEELDLSWTYSIRSEVPKYLFTNMSSLRSLDLYDCGLKGEFPQGIFYLPKLQHLSLQVNDELEGHLPTEFNSSTTPLMESILIGGTNFRGTIPNSIGNLIALKKLDLSYCRLLGGSIPSSLGNLTHLFRLHLSYYTFPSNNNNNFTTLFSSWLGKLTNLRYLDISKVILTGEIPHSLANLTHLSYIDLSGNRLTGHIPSVLTRLTQLEYLALDGNQLTGEIPLGFVNLKSLDVSNNMLSGPLPIQNLTSLEHLDVSHNQLSGTLELDLFLEFTNLTWLFLSSNKLTLMVQQQRNVRTNSMLPQLRFLGLSSCQMSKFPEFLQHQQDLWYLDVSNNSMKGTIPKWTGGLMLYFIDMSHNFITGLDDPYHFLRLPNLYILDISFNKLRGIVPVPSPSIGYYQASNNELTGEIPHQFCNLLHIEGLDFSTNRLTGELDPYCFTQYELKGLSLKNNSFNGKIPEFCATETNPFLAMIDLNGNQFQGKIPRSLVNCAALEFFDTGSNFINDTFPSWLGSLPHLKVLLLKNNALHGSIVTMSNVRSGWWFPKLIIIDLSENTLSGDLTSLCFEQWMAMKTTDLRNLGYMGQDMPSYMAVANTFYYSLTMYNKGTETEYSKILNALVVIDLSSNNFEGKIPTTIGDLLGIRSLNLSNNHLSGGIPSSLGVITYLESLDLSSNRLSGHLPQQLTGLNFLSVFNVSRNNLTGLIPQGPQFNTFSNMSYLENPGLCGEPLSRRKCETSAEKEDKIWEGETLWMVVAIGFVGGLVVGVAVENMVDWRMLIILSWRRWRNSRG